MSDCSTHAYDVPIKGMLTAEQVREAIFNGSSYASYDGAKYYADGIGMQAIADELNSRAERTCEFSPDGMGDGKLWNACSLCGGYVSADYDPPKYCPHCGAKVVGE